ncbi:protein-lysine N-methyltransferase ASCRUDRAFT_76468 [Ascoidea rubescens DSM 1968]|uniref:Protein-lysine N-methyltransferase EFM5 n=1 Tax=Ascoidea rubescens DSM 1968 TaxID=1344418 RepID=A0A1D2VFN9_9ASCO|nr:hypothetical protein ASCRUDRAFT_76468 [Ascoidea rubescens DSM 1968]ODV60488.1 hypothetical protein ASCRUDRAFT_76468 [Ascoidea rubescens DSM 1968]
MSDSDDDFPVLSDYALKALQEFQNEEKERLLQLSKVYNKPASATLKDFKNDNDHDHYHDHKNNDDLNIDLFKEDWNLSQFWYDEKTATFLARELLNGTTEDTKICIISAPSVYSAILDQLKLEDRPNLKKNIYLFEFDKRFRLLAGDSNFIFYDFKNPLKFDKLDLFKSKIDKLLIDPPFLSNECQTKAAITARVLSNSNSQILVCTGERMKDLIKKIYPTTKMTNFIPEHKNGLSNEFRCYASYKSENWDYIGENDP